ncbi:MAG: SAM-dependent chlorinase/fluorinase [Thermoleophilaceae bacterium]|nr:SAM-dependent chlorinase/fluorinase [Thermoleophilaceae bacterium]
MALRPIALLTDFGFRDPFVGICHGVILRENPGIPTIDLTHGIARQDIRAGAVALADSVPFLPADAVVVGVVDPAVGTDRRAIAVEAADGKIFVGPDNGLLTEAIERCGGAQAAFEISRSPWCLQPISDTFHGRDIFSPVAAKLAAGEPIVASGVAIEHDNLVTLDVPKTSMIDGDLTTAVLSIDQYGNARLGATPTDVESFALGSRVEIDTDVMRRQATYVRTYADAENGDLLLIVDSTDSLSISVSGGDAAQMLRLEPGKVVRILRS